MNLRYIIDILEDLLIVRKRSTFKIAASNLPMLVIVTCVKCGMSHGVGYRPVVVVDHRALRATVGREGGGGEGSACEPVVVQVVQCSFILPI